MSELVLSREARRGMPRAWLVVAILLASIGAIGTTLLSLSPSRQRVKCSRAAHKCTLSPQYVIGSDRPFSIETIQDLRLVDDGGHPAIGIWTANRHEYWTGSATDDAMAADYARVVEALHAFAAGDAPELDVEFGTSHRRMITALGVGTLALVAYYLFLASRFSRRTELRLDRAAGTATLRGAWFVRGLREETRPLSSVTGVELKRGSSVVELRLTPGWVVHREGAGIEARETLESWAKQIEAFLTSR